MSSNSFSNDIDLNSISITKLGSDKMSTNDDVLACRSYIDKSSEVFDLIGKIEERLEKIASSFSFLSYGKNKEGVYIDICFCFRDIANDLRKFKKGLKIN